MTSLTTIFTLSVGIFIAGTIAGTVAYAMNYMMRADDVIHRIILGVYVIVPSVGLIAQGENPAVVIVMMILSIIVTGRYVFNKVKSKLPRTDQSNQQQ
jgi:hypothetical protein